MPGPGTFKLRVACATDGGQSHEHELEIAGGKPALGVRAEGTCELQYTCPQSSKDRKITFDCPPGFSRPFRVVRVT